MAISSVVACHRADDAVITWKPAERSVVSPLLHPTTVAIATVIVAMQGANWNFIIDQGATESFARDRTQHYRPAALVLRFPTMTHQIEFSWDDDYEHKPIIQTGPGGLRRKIDRQICLAARGRCPQTLHLDHIET